MKPATYTTIPPDNDEFRSKGFCGPSVVATILQKPIATIVPELKKIGMKDSRGGTWLWHLEAILKKNGYILSHCKRLKDSKKLREFPIPKEDMAIAKIVWLRKDGTDSTLSHWVLMKKAHGGIWYFFGNEIGGWLQAFSEKKGREYLKNGYVKTYYEVRKA